MRKDDLPKKQIAGKKAAAGECQSTILQQNQIKNRRIIVKLMKSTRAVKPLRCNPVTSW